VVSEEGKRQMEKGKGQKGNSEKIPTFLLPFELCLLPFDLGF
jgi:hypothetical protein